MRVVGPEVDWALAGRLPGSPWAGRGLCVQTPRGWTPAHRLMEASGGPGFASPIRMEASA